MSHGRQQGGGSTADKKLTHEAVHTTVSASESFARQGKMQSCHACSGSGGIAPFNLNLGIRQTCHTVRKPTRMSNEGASS